MATDGPTPNPCDADVFLNGQPVAVLDGSSNAVERWVKAVAALAEARLDWHYSGGRAQVLHLGDADSRERVINMMHQIEPALNGRILAFFSKGEFGLYRNYAAFPY